MQGPIRSQNSGTQLFLDDDKGARTIVAAQAADWYEAWLTRFLQILRELGKRSSA